MFFFLSSLQVGILCFKQNSKYYVRNEPHLYGYIDSFGTSTIISCAYYKAMVTALWMFDKRNADKRAVWLCMADTQLESVKR